ncbi:hypothetical protein M407DRAFT_5001 [Tulasnella calospora MUT 4182]|uniref:Uncharacterized protein n=1 Tax=Tulasnella calospora MUT 4182 TaxID=1051891 RepID=A0A0C3QRV0_9AGAM|nr:hypothetical protein M407DRAFT_5001 [Tulasnella calospora MUT 4182]
MPRRVHWPGTASPNNAGPYPSIARTDDSPPWRPHHIIIVKDDLILKPVSLPHSPDRHRSEPRRWYFLTDFDFEYTDSSGVMDIVPTVLATKRNIMMGTRTWNLPLRMRIRHQRIWLLQMDNESMERESRSPNSTITVVFDTEKKREFEVVTPSTEVVTSQVIEISSARKDQPLFSGSFGKEKTLTWYLIHYLQANPQADLAGLASYFYANCEPSGSGFPACDQERGHLPVLSCSRKLDGRFSLF